MWRSTDYEPAWVVRLADKPRSLDRDRASSGKLSPCLVERRERYRLQSGGDRVQGTIL